MYVILAKAKKIYVPASGRKKAYYRLDPRTKSVEWDAQGEKIIGILKGILEKIHLLKKKGLFTKEQKAYVRKSLKELEPKLQAKRYKTEKQRQAVSKVLKEIRAELVDKPKELSEEIIHGIKNLGYAMADIKKMSTHEAKAIYYNDIRKG